LEDGEDGEPMANRIIGNTSAGGGLEYIYDDAASQAIYPVLVEQKQFDLALDIGSLTAMTTAYGQQRANPVTDYQVQPMMAERKMSTVTGELVTVGMQYGDVVPGDLVMCDFMTESQNVQEARRLAEIIVEVNENMQETVSYTLTKSGIFLTTNYLDYDRIGDLTRRIQAAEQLL
jgi:hypothetical protein